jgi:hypothetical protein
MCAWCCRMTWPCCCTSLGAGLKVKYCVQALQMQLMTWTYRWLMVTLIWVRGFRKSRLWLAAALPGCCWLGHGANCAPYTYVYAYTQSYLCILYAQRHGRHTTCSLTLTWHCPCPLIASHEFHMCSYIHTSFLVCCVATAQSTHDVLNHMTLILSLSLHHCDRRFYVW